MYLTYGTCNDGYHLSNEDNYVIYMNIINNLNIYINAEILEHIKTEKINTEFLDKHIYRWKTNHKELYIVSIVYTNDDKSAFNKRIHSFTLKIN